jgi:hypothetical protein
LVKVKTFVCIDDTDSITCGSTGKLLARLIEIIEEKGWGHCSFITRHQLYVHPDIPYTSHNSSMCFIIDLDEKHHASLIDYISDFLVHESEEGSDPGLCVAVPERINNPELLITFGQKAKKAVLTKSDAYELAKSLGIHLSEHGGTGQGVIGALAGVGLRLSGNDGRFRGRLDLGEINEVLAVNKILQHKDVDLVRGLQGEMPDHDDFIRLGEKVKTVLSGGKSVLLVVPEDNAHETAGKTQWRTCSKEELRKF